MTTPPTPSAGTVQRFELRPEAPPAAPPPARQTARFRGAPKAAWAQAVRVRFSHCDPAGIVYFARYFDLMHGVMEDWFEAVLGLSQNDLVARRRVGLGYAHAEADFFSPGFNADTLSFVPLIERIGTGSIGLAVHAYRGETPVLRADLVIVTTSLDTHRAIPLPDDLRAALERAKAACDAAG